ncbi:MAG: glutathionylspermidine synthase family protein [Alphaproteobacteria bacterium]|nr:glutathionylspermidine synthase family protein [Alphaproteobacteria bacterium]
MIRGFGVSARQDWQARVEALGLAEPILPDGTPYWVEDRGYAIAKPQIDLLYDAAAELERLTLAAIDRIVQHDMFDRFDLSPLAARLAGDSWDRQARNLIGRFDLAFVPGEAPKLLEYNADGAVSLIEAARAQAEWRDVHMPGALQWNEIDAHLDNAWRALGLPRLPVHFAGLKDDIEADATLDYLAETARAAGIDARRIDLDEIGWDGEKFVDLDGQTMRALAKIYPWAWLARDEFAAHLEVANTTVLEPAWRMLPADKRFLALLWEMFPDHPNLLPASLEPLAGPCVAKPALGRDGRGVAFHADGGLKPATGGDTQSADEDEGPRVWQALAPTAQIDGRYLMAGVWCVASQPSGLGLREADDPFVGGLARFVPHIAEEAT